MINFDNKLWTYHDRILNAIYHVEDRVADDAMKKQIDFVISTLFDREQEIIKLHFGEGLTLDEVGERLGLTKERVRQITAKTLSKMKDPIRYDAIFTPSECVALQRRNELLDELKLEHIAKYERIYELVLKYENRQEEFNTIIDRAKTLGVTPQQYVMSIRDVSLSTRTYNCLAIAGYRYLYEVSKLSLKELLSMPNLGKSCVKELHDVLVENGFNPSW